MLNAQVGGVPERPPTDEERARLEAKRLEREREAAKNGDVDIPTRPATAEDMFHLFAGMFDFDPLHTDKKKVEAPQEPTQFDPFALETLEGVQWAIENNLISQEALADFSGLIPEFAKALQQKRKRVETR